MRTHAIVSKTGWIQAYSRNPRQLARMAWELGYKDDYPLHAWIPAEPPQPNESTGGVGRTKWPDLDFELAYNEEMSRILGEKR